MTTDAANLPLMADGFEDALLGIGTRFSWPVAIYDYEKCVAVLVLRDGMTQDEAEEFIEFNVTGAYVGENTPVFIRWRSLEDFLG